LGLGHAQRPMGQHPRQPGESVRVLVERRSRDPIAARRGSAGSAVRRTS
jgi:hypothetical protein